MAHGLNTVLKRAPAQIGTQKEGKTGAGSRRIFAPHFKLQVLDSYRHDSDCKGNQRATARKYGIHRRQIQKWLQVENNLRNSVVKNECNAMEQSEGKGCGIELALRVGDDRQRGDSIRSRDGVSQATSVRVPALSGEVSYNSVPLDFTTHSRSPRPLSPQNPEAPIDLSLKKPTSVTPVPLSLPSPTASSSPTSLVQPHPDVWDLSVPAKRKYIELSSPTESLETPQKPVKLFKPYLDDFNTDSNDNASSSSAEECKQPCCMGYNPHNQYFYNQNNNICEVKGEYSYTIQELQPSYYSYPRAYPNLVPEYENSFYSPYDDPYNNSLKQRQSYSLDFKLSAIECYYEDSICKGNQRAVANKYNVHRRQVQKWLKQEDELRLRSEKTTHLVR